MDIQKIASTGTAVAVFALARANTPTIRASLFIFMTHMTSL